MGLKSTIKATFKFSELIVKALLKYQGAIFAILVVFGVRH